MFFAAYVICMPRVLCIGNISSSRLNLLSFRDLKLENFLFRDKSPESDLILIDFGLSKHFDATERIAQRVGSCYYTAPEVLHTDYDQRCDIWSAGVICYMLMTGSPPFTGSGPDAIHQSILNKAPDFGEKKFRYS